MRKIEPYIILLLFFQFPAFSGEEFTVSGVIADVRGDGPVYIYLTDQETSRKPFSGIRELRIDPPEADRILYFEFTGIPRGEYGLRFFQDTDGSGKLERGIFGPKEPWGLSV